MAVLSEDGTVEGTDDPEWSRDAGQADWIADRLAPFDSGVLTSVVPAGFAAYARLLHPAGAPRDGRGRTVRWAEVAAWSGTTLVPGGQFHDIALPEHEPEAPAPWRGQGPEEGTLTPGDAAVLADVLAGHTTTPRRCWFCLWDGYGWDNAIYLRAADHPGAVSATQARVPGPVPADVRSGPRVRLPNRDYLLYTGGVEAALAFAGSQGQTPNLWWPADRAWCVASEIDLPWTYVGGSASLVARLVSEPRIEAQQAAPGENHHRRVEGWLSQMIDGAVAGLWDSGEATVETSRGTVHARLQRPGRSHRGFLDIGYTGRNGAGGSSHCALAHRDEQLRHELSHYLTSAVVGLVGG